MKTFLICPVRGVDQSYAESIVESLEALGYRAHYPARDTNQDDETGLRICKDNWRAIQEADVVHCIWDGDSQGCLFDAGMAFAAGGKIIPVSLPPRTPHKSFQNMLEAYSCE